AFRPCQRDGGAPGQSPAGCQVSVFHNRQPPWIPVRSHRPSGEKRHPTVVSGNVRTSCHVSVSQSVTPESWPLARSLARGEKDNVVAELSSVMTSFREGDSRMKIFP